MHQALEHSNDGQNPLPAWGLNFSKLWARCPGVGGSTMQKLGELSLVGRGMGCTDFFGATDAREKGALWPDCKCGDTTQPGN